MGAIVVPDGDSGFVKNWKTLLSEKSCEAIEFHPALSRTALACEEDIATLNCTDQPETAIVVCEALFGRDNLQECSPARSLDTHCASLDAINVATERCQWHSTCDLKASKHVFADPCPAQSKFLRVKYICLNSKLKLIINFPFFTIFFSLLELYGTSLISTSTTTTTENPLEPTSTTSEPLYCPPVESRGIVFPKTVAGRAAVVECPGFERKNSKRWEKDDEYARFKCGTDGVWRSRPDLSRCKGTIGFEMNKIADELLFLPVVEVAKHLELTVEQNQFSYGGDLISTAVTIQKTANVSSIVELTSQQQQIHISEVTRVRFSYS